MTCRQTKKPAVSEQPANHGQHWTDAELTLIYRTSPSKENAALLARLLQRSAGAVDWVWRHMNEKRPIGPRGSRSLTEQIQRLRQQLGPEIEGKWGDR